MSGPVAAELERISIRLAIEDLNAEFVYLLDHLLVEPLVELFTEDALYTHGERRTQGRAALRVLFEARAASGRRTTRHLYSGLRIHIHDARAASGYCVCASFAADSLPPIPHAEPFLVADFIDEYVRGEDSKWRIARRDIQRIFVGQARA